MLRALPAVYNNRFFEHFRPSFDSEQRPLRNLKQKFATRVLHLARYGCTIGPVRVVVTVEARFSSSGGAGFEVVEGRGFSRLRCLPGLSFSGDLEDVGPVSLENVSLEELLAQVGAGEARDARGLVQIESNPHPSLLRRYSEVGKPFERGRTLPIPMPHKLNRPFPLPLSRRSLLPEVALPVRRNRKASPPPKAPAFLYPRLFAKLLCVPDDEVRMVLDLWKGRIRCKSVEVANLLLQLGRRDCVGKALQLFAWVREQPRLWPDDDVLLASVLVVVESRKLSLANKFLALYGPLSPESALVAANAYVEQGFIKDALRILEDTGVSGGSELYAKMIVKAGEGGARDLVHELLLVGRDFKLEDCTLVMTVCSRLGLNDEVEVVFQRYLNQQFKPNIVMFTTLMQARARAGKLRQALALFWNLEEAGVKPDLVAYRVMIRLCEKVGDVNKAVKVYNHMRITGFVPTSDVYNVMIRLYCKEGRLSKAKEVIREMEMLNQADTSAPYPQMEVPSRMFVSSYSDTDKSRKLECAVYCETLALYSSKRAVTSDAIGPNLGFLGSSIPENAYNAYNANLNYKSLALLPLGRIDRGGAVRAGGMSPSSLSDAIGYLLLYYIKGKKSTLHLN